MAFLCSAAKSVFSMSRMDDVLPLPSCFHLLPQLLKGQQAAQGIGVFTIDGKMIDVAFLPGAARTIALAKACGIYKGEL